MDKIVCKICKFSGSNLSAHLRKHKITSTEYRKLYPNSKIISDSCSKKLTLNQQKTNLKRYGFKSTFQVPSVIEKIGNIAVKKYGPQRYFGTAEFKDKAIQTNLKKYGVKHFVELESTRESAFNAVEKKYGVRHIWNSPTVQEKMQKRARIALDKSPTSIEKMVMDIVPKNVEFTGNKGFIVTCKKKNGELKHRCPDFIIHPIKNKKIIEVFGDYWHRLDKEKDVKKEYSSYGYKVLIIWEHQLKDDYKNTKKKILEFCQTPQRLHA